MRESFRSTSVRRNMFCLANLPISSPTPLRLSQHASRKSRIRSRGSNRGTDTIPFRSRRRHFQSVTSIASPSSHSIRPSVSTPAHIPCSPPVSTVHPVYSFLSIKRQRSRKSCASVPCSFPFTLRNNVHRLNLSMYCAKPTKRQEAMDAKSKAAAEKIRTI